MKYSSLPIIYYKRKNMEISIVRGFVRTLLNDQLRLDGHDIESFDTSHVFRASEDFIDSDTLIVKRNGDVLDEGDWSFDVDTNEVTIDIQASGDDLVEGDTVELLYSFYSKYSDNELNGYISGALLYFTQYRYQKVFEIDDDEIVSVNDENPTTAESHIIALVSAVHIDPQNINLRTPDITRSATENLSKSDQIARIFTNFNRFVGMLSFLED